MSFQYSNRSKSSDTISQFSAESSTSADSKDPVYIAAADIRRRLSENIAAPKGKFEVHLTLKTHSTLPVYRVGHVNRCFKLNKVYQSDID